MRSPRDEFFDEYFRLSLDEEGVTQESHIEVGRQDEARIDAQSAQSHCADTSDEKAADEVLFEDESSSSSLKEGEPAATTPPASNRARRRRTLEERREQNRLTVQRFYYRKKASLWKCGLLEGMREEEAQLAQEYEKLRALIKEPTRASQQHSEYTRLVLFKETLQHQNELLREMVVSQTQSFEQLQRTFKRHRQRILESPASSTTFEFVPQVSKLECDQFTQRALDEIAAQESALTSHDGVQFTLTGWDCQFNSCSSSSEGRVEDAQFLFTKRLASGLRAIDLAQQTLDMWTEPSELHAQLFPNYARSSVRVLQQIDETNFIILQTIEKALESPPLESSIASASTSTLTGAPCETVQRVQSVLQVSLLPLQSSAGHSIVIRSIPPHHYELHSEEGKENAAVEWIDLFNWCTILDGANGPDVTWGGKISPTSTSDSSIYFDMSAFDWVIYEATRTMRWEAAVADVSFSPVQ